MSEKWTAAQVPNLAGKVIIVTGANSGIGYEAARVFAAKGADTILACRNEQKALAALERIKAESPNAKAEFMPLDLASLASVRNFANTFKQTYNRLDVLVNNAGIMWVPYGQTEDGFERHLGTNHLGHFALTGLLLDLIQQTASSRVVNISSIAHRSGVMDFKNLMFAEEKNYTPQAGYGRSKLANLLFTYELQRRFEAAGNGSLALAAHPGGSNTDLIDHRPTAGFLRAVLGWVMQSAEMGALPTLRAALDPQAKGGEFFGPGSRTEIRGYPRLVSSTEAARDPQAALKLWQVSEELTGVVYNFKK